ncbi:MAG: class I SAM-dependent methyltransferase [Magnetococcales bacterium]|nr:class I SAM-dependent methyltransferase [Magnetococcales bacterium]
MDHQNYVTMAEVQDRHWWFRGRRAILLRLISTLALPDHPQILDVGCGTGANLPVLSEFGQVWGMDNNEFALQTVRKKSDVIVAHGSLPGTIPFADQRFHLITLLDVLAEIKSDREAIAALSRRMLPGGWLVITAPAFDFLWSSHDVMSHHHRRYTASQLVSSLTAAGLEVHFSTYFNMFLFVPIFVIRLMKRWLHLFPGDDSGAVPPGPINNALFSLFKLEGHVIGRGKALPFGVSVLVVARKPEK